MNEEIEPVVAPVVAVVPVVPANSDFCKAVAAQDASSNDFDPGTQAKVFRQSFQQCLTIYTR